MNELANKLSVGAIGIIENEDLCCFHPASQRRHGFVPFSRTQMGYRRVTTL